MKIDINEREQMNTFLVNQNLRSSALTNEFRVGKFLDGNPTLTSFRPQLSRIGAKFVEK